jgi:hypothetical protein
MGTSATGPSAALWVLRALWLATSVPAAIALSDGLDGRSPTVRITSLGLWWAAWAAVLLAVLVASTTGLTAARLLVPFGPVAGVGAWVAGAGVVPAGVATALASAAVLVAFSAEVGEVMVQGSAYGSERRFPLRPPAPWLAPVLLAWLVAGAALVSGPLLLAARQWVAGGLITLVAAVCVVALPPRFHQLSRRWLVIVPAGLVVHDRVVLGETLMVRHHDVVTIGLAGPDSGAADLTGPTWGVPLELELRELVTVVRAPTRVAPRGGAIHARAVLVAPSRPGHVLRALASRAAQAASPPPST